MAGRFVHSLRGWLESRHAPLILAIMAVVVMLPALGHGWVLGDMMFRGRVLGWSGPNRRVGGAVWVAGLAGLLYVLDETNYFPVAFVANRNAVIALFFGLLAVLMHDKWRRESSIGGAVLACMFLALSLLSAEAGVATVAYNGAYALVFEQGK